MSASLPPYSALPPEAPPLYSRGVVEEVVAGEKAEPEADHGQHDPPPSLLNEDVRASHTPSAPSFLLPALLWCRTA